MHYQNKDFYKPNYLFHASSQRGLKVLEPRRFTTRNKAEGPQVFATPDIAYVSCFLTRINSTHCTIGKFNDDPWHFITCISEDEFKKKDIGGSIYVLDPEDFHYNQNDPMHIYEWTSTQSVKPIEELVYESSVQAMKDFGVQVYLVDEERWKEIQNDKDHGYEIVPTLKKYN